MRTSLIIIPIIIAVVVVVGIYAISFNESQVVEIKNELGNEPEDNDKLTIEIDKKLEDIKNNAEKSKDVETSYDPARDREWLTSGPFQIDRSEYVLGEKVFLVIGDLSIEEKGDVVFFAPLNETHYKVFTTIPFDGMVKREFNFYVEPDLSRSKGFCTKDQLVGDWRVVFRGTNYESLYFKVTEQILPGDESKFEKPLC